MRDFGYLVMTEILLVLMAFVTGLVIAAAAALLVFNGMLLLNWLLTPPPEKKGVTVASLCGCARVSHG